MLAFAFRVKVLNTFLVVPSSLHIVLRPVQVFNRGGERERIFNQQPTCPSLLFHRNDFSRPALRHRSLNSLFLVAFHLPDYRGGELIRAGPAQPEKAHGSEKNRRDESLGVGV